MTRRGEPVPEYLRGLPDPWGMVVALDQALAAESLPPDVFQVRTAVETLARCFRYLIEDDPDPLHERWFAEVAYFEETYDSFDFPDFFDDISNGLRHHFRRLDGVRRDAVDAYLTWIVPELYPDVELDAESLARYGELWCGVCVRTTMSAISAWLWTHRVEIGANPVLMRRLFEVYRLGAFHLPDRDDVTRWVFDEAIAMDPARARALLVELMTATDLSDARRNEAEERLAWLDELTP